MTTKRLYKTLLPALLCCVAALGMPASVQAQTVTNMINGDSIHIDACVLGGGVIYDDGGAIGDYSNNFDGVVVIQASAGITINVTGTYETESCCDRLTISDASTTLLDEAGGTGTVNVSSSMGQVLIHFHSDGSVTGSGLVLTWTVSGISEACPNPVTNLDTVNVTTTSIGLTWTAVNAAGPFTVICNDVPYTGITTTSYTLTGLNPSTAYDISVVATASAGNRCCAATLNTHTACGTAMMPYSEGFEGMADGSFPVCWLQIINFDDEESIPQVVASHHSSGSRSLMLSCGNSNSPGHFGIVATPPIAGVGSHTVRLQMRTSHYGTCVQFGLCDSAGSEYNQYGFTPLQTVYLNNTTAWQQYSFTWNTTTEGRRLALRMVQSDQGGTAGRRVYIDDLGVEECGVDDLAVSMIEYDRVTLQWSSFGNPTCTVGVRRVGALVDTLTFNAASSPLNITGLAAATTYTFTVYPTCSGSLNIGRSVTATTAPMPTLAEGYCSNFLELGHLPEEWTYRHLGGGCGASFSYNNGIHVRDGCGGSDILVVSERMIGLAGKTVRVDFTNEDNDARVILGTMVHPDDLSSFVPLAYDTCRGIRHTLVATVPVGSTGRHIALRANNPGWYIDVTYTSVSCTACPVDEPHVYHRGATYMEVGWAQPYDTVLVQYGPTDFTLGTGTIDTFYNTTRGTIDGLVAATDYDLYFYRPCQTPCRDMRRIYRTAHRDYPLPYCENFGTLYDYNDWDYYQGDWQRIEELNGNPSFTGQPYDSYTGRSLRFSSWGFDWGYRTAAMLPDVAVDSTTRLSFYINDNAPSSIITIAAIRDEHFGPYGSRNYDQHVETLDTIHINAQYKRRHYTYAFRPSDTLLNSRIVIRYRHPYEYSYYNCYIDELQFVHSSYGTLQNTYTGFDTAAFNLTSLQGATSVEVTLEGGGDTFTDTIALADIHSFGFGGLDTGTLYRCYVRPLDDGCTSYAGYIITHSYGGGGYGDCQDFSSVLSYELPAGWAADGTTQVTTGDYLQLSAHSAVAMHPTQWAGNMVFSFRARSSVANDTLLFGSQPADNIHPDSTHFTFTPAVFTTIDTFVVGSQWQYYTINLPSDGSEAVRYTFRSGNGTLSLDDIGYSTCPIVHFEAEGNSILCTIDEGMETSYILHLTDSSGNDDRVIFVESNPFRVPNLLNNVRYDISWRCLNSSEGCRPTVSVRTGGLTPLPYCVDFNVGTGTLNIPSTWSFYKPVSYAEARLDTWGPSMYMNSNNGNRWMYLVLPAFDTDSALTLSAYMHCPYYGCTQIGYMASATDTASFVPLWTSGNNSWPNPVVDLSGHTSGRVAIRVRNYMYLFNLHVYGFPKAKVSLVAHRQLKITTAVDVPYWLRYHNGRTDSIFYVDTNVLDLYEPEYGDAHITQVCDSTGYTCDGEQYYNFSWRTSVPYCFTPNWWGQTPGGINHQPDGYNSVSTNRNSNDNRFYLVFEPNNSQWTVLPEPDVDSLKHLGMGVEFYATSEKDSLVVGVMTDAYDTLSFVPVDTLVYRKSADSLQVDLVYFENYADTGRWVALHRLRASGGGNLNVGNIMVDACPASLGAQASLTRWNQVKIDAPRTPFYVEYCHYPNTQGDGSNVIQRIDSVPTILILDPETRYNFYFRCDSLGTTCMPAQQVVTLGAPLDVPTCVDFDTVTVGTNPHNWTSRNPGIGVINTVAHSGDKSLAMPVGVTSYIITPDVNIDSIKKIAVSVWYRVEDLSDRLVVGVMSNPSDLNTFHPIRSLAPMEVGEWQHGLVEFSNAPDDAHFIVLRARSNRQPGGRMIYVDDLYVTDCAAFDLRVQSLTNASIDLTWSHVGNPDVTVEVVDDDVVTNVITGATPPLHIEPLNMLHYYTFRFNSVCSATDTGFCTTNHIDSLSVVTPAPGVGCVNPTDLASPQAVFYSGTYNNPYAHAGAVNYGSLHPDSRHTVCYDTAQRDLRTGNQLRTIPVGYTSSVRLGNWSSNAYTPEAEGVVYSLFVDTSSFELLLLRYAAVLQDPMHDPADQPRFRMELLDTNYNIIDSACTSADFIADQSLGWHTADDGVLWKDWTAVGVDLSGHAGEQVYFRLTTYDCNEGSHYGYAYFTLECMRKNMNTVSCGDVDSNTLSAPEGFHYRWYTSQSGATVSTAQSITVPSEDITYYCVVSKLDNPSCNFTISAYGGTRYPMAGFDTSMVVDSCHFYVDFINTSGISNDGVTLLPGERCESAYWDFGNGTTSVNYHGHAVYTQPGTYTVRLISGIALDECQDTAYMTLVLDLPPGMAPSDTTAVSICDNQWYLFHGQPYNTAGTYYHNVPVPNSQCDSIYVLQLDVRATSASDTAATVCDSITWRGNFYDTTGIYMSAPVGLNAVACDSTRRLTLTVNYSQETVDSIVICPGYPFLYRGVDYGGPTAFDALLTTRQNCDSLVHVTLFERSASYRVEAQYRFDSTDWHDTDSLLVGCARTTLDVRDTTVGEDSRIWSFFMRDTAWTGVDTVFTVQFDTFRNDLTAYLALEAIDTLGCHDTLTWPVFIFSKPLPDFRWEPEVPAMHNPEAQFRNITLPDTSTYLWRIQQTEGGSFDTTSVTAPFYHWGEEGDNMVGDYTVRLIASLLHNADSFRMDTVQWVDSTLRNLLLYEAFSHTCVDSMEHIVTITNDYLQFPNLVTPNGDGTNDIWEVVNLLEFGNYQMNELWIYDRTGALVYHVRDISSADQFWDPNATRSPDGTYYFRFSARGPYGLVKRNGSIEVLR